ncbi:MAG: hypothetical protein VYC39_06805 [Myxococcota bacterium]|nr:hypothetical protein [Myxococcota bacterium]
MAMKNPGFLSSFILFGLISCQQEAPSGRSCVVAADCGLGFNCIEGLCQKQPSQSNPLDSGIFRGDVGFADLVDATSVKTDSSATPDSGFPRLDSGVTSRDATAPIDSGPQTDAMVRPDAMPKPDAAIWPDATPMEPDSGFMDARTFPPDSGEVDAGFAPDAAAPDASVALPASRGVYEFTPVVVPGISSSEELTQVAISPNGEWLVVSERYEKIHIIEQATQTLVRTVNLPGLGSDLGLVSDIAFDQQGLFFLVTVTVIPRSSSGSRSGRLFRAEANGQNIQEISSARINGREYHAIAVDNQTNEIRVLSRPEGSSPNYMVIHTYDDATQALTSAVTQNTSAGCEDLEWINDQFGQRGLVYVCGYNGITLGHYDSTGGFVNGPGFGAASNTHRIAARPQGDYALSIESGSTSKLSRFTQGVWNVGSSGTVNFGHTGMWGIGFSDDGNRALAVGRYNSNNSIYIKEYRHGFYNRTELTDVSILGFDQAPYLGRNGVWLWELVWRPGLDCGYIVGGCSTFSCSRGYLIGFRVTNGQRQCP